jgi:beta-galactosidase GanA
MIYRNFYGALKHYNVDVIDTAHTLDGYEILISPFTTTLREYGFEERVRAWVEQGGVWIVGPMSDIMDENTCKYTNAPYSFLEEFAGVYTKYQLPVDNDVFQAKWQDGSVSKVSACFDAYETKDSKSLAVYANGEFEGLSVITERKIGKGKVVLLGSVPSIDVLRKLISIEPIEQASDNVIIVERTGEEDGIIVLETEHKEGVVFLKTRYKDLCNGELYCGKMTLNPYEVRVLQKLL